MRIVNKIEAKTPQMPRRKRVAAYARVSMESKRLQHSLSAQVSFYSSLIQSNPAWEYVGVYADNGITGTKAEAREEFNRMIADCEAGKIDIVLTKSISRFARNTVDLLNTVRRLKELGVSVQFEKERIDSLTEDGELMLTLLASFAQEEIRSLSDNVKWGTRKRFEKGIPNGRFQIYGYRWEGDHLVVHEEEAKIVRLIYDNYMNGLSAETTEKQLAEMGVKSYNHKYDGEEKCSTPHLTEDEIKAMFISAANKLIGKKTAIISPLRASLDIAFDTSALEAETEKLQEELMVASDLIQKCIYENAHVALDQREYQKRYDSLTARFDIAKARLEEIETAIADKKSRRAAIESFLGTLAQADLMGKFDPVLWCGLVDHVTVYSKDDVLFTFKNGQEIRA